MQKIFVKTVENGEEKSMEVTVPDGASVTFEELFNLLETEEPVKKDKKKKIPTAVSYYINMVKKQYYPNNSYSEVCKILMGIPIYALQSILLKQIAIEMDKRYPDHISKSPAIWGISTVSERVGEIDKTCVKDYSKFAAFRSKEEAEKALRMWNNFLEQPPQTWENEESCE